MQTETNLTSTTKTIWLSFGQNAEETKATHQLTTLILRGGNLATSRIWLGTVSHSLKMLVKTRRKV